MRIEPTGWVNFIVSNQSKAVMSQRADDVGVSGFCLDQHLRVITNPWLFQLCFISVFGSNRSIGTLLFYLIEISFSLKDLVIGTTRRLIYHVLVGQ